MTSTDPPLLATLVRRLHLVVRDQVHADLVAAGHTELTIAHMSVFQTPGAEGIRPTVLAAPDEHDEAGDEPPAERAGAARLPRTGALRTNRRATVIRLTDKGHEVEQILQRRAV